MRGSTKPIFAMHGWAAPSWSEPRLRRADLRGAYLRLAKLDGADLSDANLSDAEGLTQAQLVLAHHNSGTKLPEGWTGLEDVARLGGGAAVWNAWRPEQDDPKARAPSTTAMFTAASNTRRCWDWRCRVD